MYGSEKVNKPFIELIKRGQVLYKRPKSQVFEWAQSSVSRSVSATLGL